MGNGGEQHTPNFTMNDRVDQCIEDSDAWFPNMPHDQSDLSLALWSLCICGEAGELGNKVKKYLRGSMTLEELLPLATGELVDVLVYAFNMAAVLNIDLDWEYDKVRTKNDARFRPLGRGRNV